MLSRRHVLLFVGFMESLTYVAIVFGWPTLNYMLKKEGVYSHLCEPLKEVEEGENITTTESSVMIKLYQPWFYGDHDIYQPWYAGEERTITSQVSCPEQMRLINLAYNIAMCLGAILGFIWGYVIDRFGIRILRISFNFLTTSGVLLLMFTTKEMPYLLFPGLISIFVIGIPVRISCLQISELFPKQRSTIIALYTGANTASAAAFTLLKTFYDGGLSYTWTMGVFVGVTLLGIPPTFLLFPVRDMGQFKEEEQKKEMTKEKVPEDINNDEKSVPTLLSSLFSLSSLLYNFWFSWLILYSFYYNGSLHLWVDRTTNDPNELAKYVDILGISQLGGLVIAPALGFLIDRNMKRARESDKTRGSLEERTERIKTNFSALLITTLTLTGIQLTKFFDTPATIFSSIFFYIALRSMVMGTSMSYLRERFPKRHFNRLVGITGTFRGFCFLLQFPMFIWESEQPIGVASFNLACLLMAFVLPLHLLTPLLPALIKREERKLQKTNSKLEDIAVISKEFD